MDKLVQARLQAVIDQEIALADIIEDLVDRPSDELLEEAVLTSQILVVNIQIAQADWHHFMPGLPDSVARMFCDFELNSAREHQKSFEETFSRSNVGNFLICPELKRVYLEIADLFREMAQNKQTALDPA